MDTTASAIISQRQVERIMSYIQKGIDQGARLVVGGGRPGGDLKEGNWINPTLFADVDNQMAICAGRNIWPSTVSYPF